jgi:hypothetical protein
MQSEDLQTLTASEPLTLEEEYAMQGMGYHSAGSGCSISAPDLQSRGAETKTVNLTFCIAESFAYSNRPLRTDIHHPRSRGSPYTRPTYTRRHFLPSNDRGCQSLHQRRRTGQRGRANICTKRRGSRNYDCGYAVVPLSVPLSHPTRRIGVPMQRPCTRGTVCVPPLRRYMCTARRSGACDTNQCDQHAVDRVVQETRVRTD